MNYLILGLIFIITWISICLFFYIRYIASSMEGTKLDNLICSLCKWIVGIGFNVLNWIMDAFGYIGRATLSFDFKTCGRRVKLLPGAVKCHAIVFLIWYYR